MGSEQGVGGGCLGGPHIWLAAEHGVVVRQQGRHRTGHEELAQAWGRPAAVSKEWQQEPPACVLAPSAPSWPRRRFACRPLFLQDWQTLMDAGNGDWKESVQLVRAALLSLRLPLRRLETPACFDGIESMQQPSGLRPLPPVSPTAHRSACWLTTRCTNLCRRLSGALWA